MKETPIIMSGNHPKLILDGIKTMTRRVMKPQPSDDFFSVIAQHLVTGEEYWVFVRLNAEENKPFIIKCPYGRVGDRLWVRETFFLAQDENDNDIPIYKADKPDASFSWRPSIFMPRLASRITRDITLLRVEQLRDISEAAAQAEGGYTIAEFIKTFLCLNHLPEDANPWDWVIGW